MSGAIGPGDEVICVDNKPRKPGIGVAMARMLKVGAKYTVLAAIPDGYSKGIHLVEINTEGIGYYADRFRLESKKGEKASDSFMRTIKRPIPGLDPDLPPTIAPVKKEEVDA
jgi:hypothetical protein